MNPGPLALQATALTNRPWLLGDVKKMKQGGPLDILKAQLAPAFVVRFSYRS